MKAILQQMRGSSVLEIAVVTMLSLSMLLGAVGVSEVLMTSYRVSRSADLVAFDHSLKPLRIDAEGKLSLDEASLASGLNGLADRAVTSLSGALIGAERGYRVELELGVVYINPGSGRVERIVTPSSLTQARGTLVLTSAQRLSTRFDREFERLVGKPGEVSQYAIPVPGAAGSDSQFLPMVAVLGIRVFVSLEGSPTAHALKRLGALEDSVIFDWKVVPVRGEVAVL